MSIRKASIALAAGLVLGAPSVALASPDRPVTAQVERDQAPAPATTTDTASYSQREAQDKQVAEYEGGQTVIVFSGAAFVALILLLILL
jgi:hypothetical protein